VLVFVDVRVDPKGMSQGVLVVPECELTLTQHIIPPATGAPRSHARFPSDTLALSDSALAQIVDQFVRTIPDSVVVADSVLVEASEQFVRTIPDSVAVADGRTVQHITGLYPRTDLFPSNTLFPSG
jgi:hypothetical protein